VLKSIGSNWARLVLAIAATFITLPFVISMLGDEGYGTWVLISSLTGYLGLLAVGVPMASVKYLSEFRAKRDTEELNRIVDTAVGFYLMMGVAALVVGLGFFVAFEYGYAIPEILRSDARLAFLITLVASALSFIVLLPGGIMIAYEDFVHRNVLIVTAIALRLALILVVLPLEPSLSSLAAIQVAYLVFDFTATFFVMKRRYREIRFGVRDFNWPTLRKIFAFSVFVLLTAVSSRIAYETDAIVISAILGVRQAAYYSVPSSLALYVVDGIRGISGVVMPAVARLSVEGDREELRIFFLKWSKIALSVTLVVGTYLILFGPAFIGYWIDTTYQEKAGQVLIIMMLAHLIYLPARGVATPLLNGLDAPHVPAYGMLVCALTNLGLSIALAKPLGLEGVAIGTALPNAVYGVYLRVMACARIGLPGWQFVRYVAVKAVLGWIPCATLLYTLSKGAEVTGLVDLMAWGLATFALFGVVWLGFVYRNDPHFDLFKAAQNWVRDKRGLGRGA
jgi:O-antigen/teichoic acid export membrane protein